MVESVPAGTAAASVRCGGLVVFSDEEGNLLVAPVFGYFVFFTVSGEPFDPA